MEKDDKWRKLASAFYSQAHNDFREFDKLDQELKDTEAGKLCQEYIETQNHELLDKAGYIITGTSYWYVYLGRLM